ncbi:tRNA (guanine(9)-N(1))-methyltransferase [Coemansia sp. RSA 552]|nr:tRNA (guanine(9)-N(1))-methyltransferase [Coemansia sp. RSA 552]
MSCTGEEGMPESKRQRPNSPSPAAAATAAVAGVAPKSRAPSAKNYTPKTMSLEEYQKLSLNQQKKVMRQEMWDDKAEEQQDKKREKRRERRQRYKRRVALGEVPARRLPSEQTRSGYQIAIDMSFDDKMSDKEIKSVCSQVLRCYAANRQAASRVDLHVTQLQEKSQQRFDTVIVDHVNWSKDYISFHDTEYLDLFAKESLVYLTADSPNVAQELDPEKVYIVGGLVDKNRYPRLTLDQAEKQGIAHAQLPIGQYIQLSTRKVVTVNQIFEILLKFVETRDWKTAFLDVIPQRKFKDDSNGPKDDDSGSEDDGSDSEDDAKSSECPQ